MRVIKEIDNASEITMSHYLCDGIGIQQPESSHKLVNNDKWLIKYQNIQTLL